MLVIALVVGACGKRTAEPPPPPPADAGVSLPGDFSGSGPGTLVKATTLPMVDRRLRAVTSVLARVTYDSTSGVTNEPTEVTGTVFAPTGKPPEGGWPILAFGHPTTGILPECGPSLSPTLMNLSSTILYFVKAGYVVAMSDFQGLGDDRTYHPYLDATTAAYNLIDSVRAARKIVPNASDRWLAFGMSQGAQGSFAANELAGEYGSGLNLVGAVSLSPPLDISGFADSAAAGALTKDQQPAYTALLATFAKENPAVDLDRYRRGVVKDQWDLLQQCGFTRSEERAKVLDEVTPDDLRPSSEEATTAVRDHLRESTLPRRPTTAPVLVIYGGQDALIPPAWTDAALQRACELGDVIDINLQPDKGHADIDVSSTLPWVAARFKGEPAPNNCASFVAPRGAGRPGTRRRATSRRGRMTTNSGQAVAVSAQPRRAHRMPQPAPSSRGRIIGLDGARGLSCLGVAVMHVTAHYSPHTSALYKTNILGMSLIFFYVLSGFLLFLPYVRNLTAERADAMLPSTRNFAVHRIARILPGYVVIFLLVNFVLQAAFIESPVLQRAGIDNGVGMITDPGQLLANLTLLQSYFPAYFQTGINTSWSLTLEYAFYAVLPLLGVLLFMMRKRTGLRPLTIALIGSMSLVALGFIGRLFIPIVNAKTGITDPTLLDWGPNWGAVYSRTLLTNADNFAVGMLGAVAIVAMERPSIARR